MFRGHKDLLGMKELSAEEILLILDRACMMKDIITGKAENQFNMNNKILVTLFYENSTRTSLSFKVAGQHLGMKPLSMSVAASSVSKGESLTDTARTLESMGADFIIIRHSMSGAPHFLAKNINASVINAGDGMNEHPTQSLLDMLTIKEKIGKFEGIKVAILGDIYHSRVARSNIWALKKLGAEITVGAPRTLLPKDLHLAGVSVFSTVHEALVDADVVMGLRIQTERQQSGLFPSTKEYARFFGVDDKRLKLAKPNALVMHPGPVNRGVELSTSVIDGSQSVIEEQVLNGVAARMAVLELFSKEGA